MNLFNKIVYVTLRAPLMLYVKLKFNASFSLARPKSKTYMVLSNHNTDWDPILVGMSFRRPMSYVTSEHIFRRGFGKIVKFLVDPISRAKGTTEARTALEILRRLRSGENVCMFAEGNRSFNGLTSPISPATAKLVKKSRAGLVTYRMRGGYFTSPRWSNTLRRGRLTGEPVNEYTPERLAQMTVEEIYEAIKRDLFVDAYGDMRERPVAYRGRALAEGLESALYMCPKCGRIGAMTSNEDTLKCECGMSAAYGEHGELTGDAPFASVTEWDEWQRAELSRTLPALRDERQTLIRINSDHTDEACGEVALEMDAERLLLGDRIYPLSEVLDMSIIQKNTLVLSTADKGYYELDLSGDASAKKYLDLFEAVRLKNFQNN